MSVAFFALLAFFVSACGGDDAAPTDASTDRAEDSSDEDAAEEDAAEEDAAEEDAAEEDAAQEDAAQEDAAEEDAAEEDATEADGGCVPASETETVCDGIDDDCNGLVDDVDDGDDGIYDCLRIALVGNGGSFGSSDFVAWIGDQTAGATITRISIALDEELTREQLDAYDIVILDRLLREYTSEEAENLEGWVSAGGGVIALSGYSGGADDFRANGLLAPFGIALSGAGGLRSGPVVSFVEHPTTTDLSSITFSGGFDVTATNEAAVVIAELPAPGGHAAMVVESGEGRVLVWGDEWIEFDSQWSSMPEVPLLWRNFLGWVAHFR